MSIFSASLSRPPTQSSKLDGHIDLTDNTEPTQEELTPVTDPDEVPVALQTTTSWVPNAGKLRQELARRKFAKYSEERYISKASEDEILDVDPQDSTSNVVSRVATKVAGTEGDSGSLRKTPGRIRRGQQKVKGLLHYRTKHKNVRDNDTQIDVLYENQRGSWLFGTPLFSSKSLLNFDPPAWTNGANHTSSVNITNAQLPDPSWQWAWKMWYVDMSLDVDEQGWQYSFMFQNRYPWHGTHPWCYSFVRRRKWIRMRVRRQRQPMVGVDEEGTGKGLAPTHKLNADYFSVHPAGQVGRSASSFDFSNGEDLDGEGVQDVEDEIDDMPTLLCGLKSASVDREKINLVLRYMEHGGEDTHYLADEIPHIMTFFVFQHSRRQLLSSMLRTLDESQQKSTSGEPLPRDGKGKQKATSSKSPLQQHEGRSSEIDEDRKKRKAANLTRAVEAADEEIKKLEFWSDIREVAQSGEGLGTAENICQSGGPGKPED